MKDLIFDFDGTLVDTGEGIMNCVRLTFQHYGVPVPSEDELRTFVGPPLAKTFPQYGIPVEKAEEAVGYFRVNYADFGKDQCHPYAGIAEALAELKAAGYRLHVGTSKPEHFARLLLERFDLMGYFDCVVGATTDGTREKKIDVLKCLLNKIDTRDVLMIGDTRYDVEGARELGIDTLGVSWGYESEQSLLQHGAVATVATPIEMIKYLTE